MRLPTHPVISVLAATVATAGIALGVLSARAMPERLSVGDHRLRFSVTGSGSPTVVLEAFGSGHLEIWGRLQPEIARYARVVAYDHAGYGGSEPGPKPRDAARIAGELHALLSKANLPPPYVLVGYSFGGPFIRVFADLYPDEVKGLVFLDPTQEQFTEWLRKHFPELNQVTEADRRKQDEWGAQSDSLEMARRARLPEVPITLITASKEIGPLGRRLRPVVHEAHSSWLRQYPQAKHVITTNSDHGLIFTEPELIATAVKEVVGSVRQPSPRSSQ